MALTDINFSEGEGQDFLVELPAVSHDGSLGDMVVESGGQPLMGEFPAQEGGGDVFIITE